MPPMGQPLALRGREAPLYLRLDIDALTRLEDLHQAGLRTLYERGMVVTALRTVVWAAARQDGSDRWRGAPGPDGTLPANPWTLAAASALLQAHLDGGGTMEELDAAAAAAITGALGPPGPAGPPTTPAPTAAPASTASPTG